MKPPDGLDVARLVGVATNQTTDLGMSFLAPLSTPPTKTPPRSISSSYLAPQLWTDIPISFPPATKMSLSVEIVTPNGHKYSQPTGLFINNEFVAASSGQTITSLDPAYVAKAPSHA